MKQSFRINEQDRRAAWMRDCEKRVTALLPSMAGKIDWQTATHLYNVQMSSIDAANKLISIASTQENG